MFRRLSVDYTWDSSETLICNLFCKVVHSACLVFPAKTITGQAEPVTGQPEPAPYTAVLMSENGQKSRKTSPLHPNLSEPRCTKALRCVECCPNTPPTLPLHSTHTPPFKMVLKNCSTGSSMRKDREYLGGVLVESLWSVGEVFKQHSTPLKPLYRKAFREIWVECGVLDEFRSTCADICIIYNGTCIVINIKYRVGQQTKLIVQLYLLSITRNYLFTTLRPLLMYSPLIYCLRNHPRIFK